jgi:4-hydroxy 2-oxovalerate aldolase
MDNSAIMLLNLLAKLHPRKVFMAGLDGYSSVSDNYCQNRLEIKKDVEENEIHNRAMAHRIASLQSVLDFDFITPSIYINGKY